MAGDGNRCKLRAEIPGFNKEGLRISVNGNQVSISAETRKAKEENNGEQVVRRECCYGRQYRAFTLAQAVDDSKATAKHTDAILELVLPKKAA